MQDLGPVHQHIANKFFDGHGWVYNGSAAMHNDIIYYCCRARDVSGQSHIAMQTFCVERDHESWRPLSEPCLLAIPTAHRVQDDTGPQDARVFVYKGDVWVVFNMLCADGCRRMHVSNTEDAVPITLHVDGRDLSRVEKNWTPFVIDNKLHFIYSFFPLVVLRLNDETGNCSVVHRSTNASPPLPGRNYRGGSVAIDNGNCAFEGWLHTTYINPSFVCPSAELAPPPAVSTKHVYRCHRFTLTNDYKLSVGSEVTFTGQQIEQVYGVVKYGVVLNVNDRFTVVKSLQERV